MMNLKVAAILLVFLSLISTKSFADFGGDCGTAIFQVINETNESYEMPNIWGDISVDNNKQTIEANSTQPLGNLKSYCSNSTCYINTGAFTVGTCQFTNIQLKVESKGSVTPSCKIKDHTVDGSYSDCNVEFETTSGHASYPTLVIQSGGLTAAFLSLLNFTGDNE